METPVGKPVTKSEAGWDLMGRMGLVDGRRRLMGGEAGGILDVQVPSCGLVPFSEKKASSCLLHADLFELGSWL